MAEALVGRLADGDCTCFGANVSIVSASDFTIVVPTRNRPVTTFETLKYLVTELKWDNPIIVVDQSDDRGAKLQSLLTGSGFESVTRIYQDQRGTSVGRNFGAGHVKTDWIFFLDDDVMPNRLYLQTIAEFLTENVWVDVVQPSVRPAGDWNEYVLDPDAWLKRAFGEPRAREQNPTDWDGVRWFQTRLASPYDTAAIGLGTAFVISRRAFFGVGGFDQTLVGLGDDRELAVRLWWYGYRIHQLPQAVGFHLRVADGGTRVRAKTRLPRPFAKLTQPLPAPGLIYVYLKWFPGYPTYSYLGYHVMHWLKRPLLLPSRLVRLVIGFRHARALMRTGPQYMDNRLPLPRSEALRTAGSTE